MLVCHVMSQRGTDECAQQGKSITAMSSAELMADDAAHNAAGDHASCRIAMVAVTGVAGLLRPALSDVSILMFAMRTGFDHNNNRVIAAVGFTSFMVFREFVIIILFMVMIGKCSLRQYSDRHQADYKNEALHGAIPLIELYGQYINGRLNGN